MGRIVIGDPNSHLETKQLGTTVSVLNELATDLREIKEECRIAESVKAFADTIRKSRQGWAMTSTRVRVRSGSAHSVTEKEIANWS